MRGGSTIWRTIQGVFNEYDGLLTPTVGGLPVPNAGDGRDARSRSHQRTSRRAVHWLGV